MPDIWNFPPKPAMSHMPRFRGVPLPLLPLASWRLFCPWPEGRWNILRGRKGRREKRIEWPPCPANGKEAAINVEEIKRPELSAQLVANNIAHQIQQRISFRRAMKRAVQSAIRTGAEGIKIQCAGRLGGAEIARTESYHEGRVPLHTLRADIDYAEVPAFTTYGVVGVKCWIFKGEVVEERRGRTYSTGS